MTHQATVAHLQGRSTFPCRVALEDFTISVFAGPDKHVNMSKSRWEELQVKAEYDGVTQKTRWLALPLADEIRDGARQRQQEPANSGEDSADSSLDIGDEEVGNSEAATSTRESGAATVKSSTTQSVTEAGMARLKAHCVDVSFTLLNNCSFIVWFNVDAEGAAVPAEGASESSDGVLSEPLRPRVKPKKVHFVSFAVEGSNANRTGSLTGGIRGDKKPTSSSKEALSAAASKSAAKMSAWAKNTFLKLSSRSSAGEVSKKKAEDEAARQQALAAYAKASAKGLDDGRLLERGDYSTVISGVDPSEAYNAPGGRKRFHLLLKPGSSKVPMSGTGVPVFLSFTMVAAFAEADPVVVPRNFHRFVVVMDQVVLDLTEAAHAMELPGHGETRGKETAPQHSITGYGFGLTSNSVVRGGQPTLRSVILDSGAIRSAEGSGIRSINFAAHHASSNERELTEEDYKRLPTSVCIVSASCVEGNKERVGHRRVTVSRFKTSSTDGLCKPSYKCQMLLFIRRRLESGEIVEEPADQAIDLAGILNEEYYPPHIRQVRFSLGEIMYVRLCRYCFVDSARNRALLLMPYDFDNEGVVISSPSNEPVAGWILDANSEHGRAADRPNVAPGESRGATCIEPNAGSNVATPVQQQHPSAQPSTPTQKSSPPPPPQTMEERMNALNAPQQGNELDSPPTPPLSADNPFLTQASTTYFPAPQHKSASDAKPLARQDGQHTISFVSCTDAGAAGEPKAGVNDDDFIGDWGSGGGVQHDAPAIEITPEPGSDNPFLFFGGEEGGSGRSAVAAQDEGSQTPVEAARYFFGEHSNDAFEITPFPDSPAYSRGHK